MCIHDQMYMAARTKQLAKREAKTYLKIEIKINQKIGQRMLWVFIVLPSFRGDLTNEMASVNFGRFALGRVQTVKRHH